MRVGIYARQSQTRDDQRSVSMETQIAACREYAERQGWTVVEVYTDLNTPADAVDKRTAFADLLVAAEGGLLDCVLSYDTSRLWRSVSIETALRQKMRDSSITHLATLTGIEDLDYSKNPEALAMRQIRDVLAELDSNMRASKLRDMQASRAKEGKANGGGRRPFGWIDHLRSAVDDGEAELIREAAERILNDEPAYSISNDWRDRGIRTSAGKLWSPPSLLRMLRSPTLIGMRTHGKELHKAQWDPILDEATHRALCSTLDRRRKYKPGGNGQPALLSGLGLLFCAECRSRMSAGQANGQRVYRCRKDIGAAACGKVSIRAAILEEHIAEQLTQLVPYKNIAAWREKAKQSSERCDELAAQIEHYEQLRGEADEDRESGIISRHEYLDKMQRYNAKLAGLRDELNREGTASDEAMDFLYGPQRDEWWLVTVRDYKAPDEQREDFRKALRLFIERIEVIPAKHRSKVDIDRVKITPKKIIGAT